MHISVALARIIGVNLEVLGEIDIANLTLTTSMMTDPGELAGFSNAIGVFVGNLGVEDGMFTFDNYRFTYAGLPVDVARRLVSEWEDVKDGDRDEAEWPGDGEPEALPHNFFGLGLPEFTEEMKKYGTMVVSPGMVVTREVRSDNSRFFATLDNAGRVIGGHYG